MTKKQSWRRWGDVETGRLVIGVPVAPLLVATTILLFFRLFADDVNAYQVAAISVVWFTCVFGAYLASARLRGSVSRVGCLICGAVTGASWLPVVIVARTNFPIWALAPFSLTPRTDSALHYYQREHTDPKMWSATVLLALVGTLQGWIFWRYAIRPAPEPIDAAVFE